MGLRSKVSSEWQDFKDGYQRSYESDESDVSCVTGEKVETVWESLGPPIFRIPMILIFGAVSAAIPALVLADSDLPIGPWDDPFACTLLLAAFIGIFFESRHVMNRPPQDHYDPTVKRPPKTRVELSMLAPALLLAPITMFTSVPPSWITVGLFLDSVQTAFRGRWIVGAKVAVVAAIVPIAVGLGVDLGVESALYSTASPDAPTLWRELLATVALFVLLARGNGVITDLRKEVSKAREARDAAIASEQARIARELHDVVAHHVTAMTLQAEAAKSTGDPAALDQVAASGRSALVELRRMLGVLRKPDADDATATDGPQPTIDDIDQLAASMATGLDVSVERTGDIRDLPRGLELCVYRVVQEALTNTMKHSTADRATVAMAFGDDRLDIEIVDDGRPRPRPKAPSSGYGLIGMRERIALLEGELEAGPRTDRAGFRIHASLPLAS